MKYRVMKLLLSRNQWEMIGKKAGWIKEASSMSSRIGNLHRAVRSVCDPCAQRAMISMQGILKVRDFKGQVKKDAPEAHMVIPRGQVVLSPNAIKLPGLKSADDIGFRIEDDGKVTAIIPEYETHGVGKMVDKMIEIYNKLEAEDRDKERENHPYENKPVEEVENHPYIDPEATEGYSGVQTLGF